MNRFACAVLIVVVSGMASLCVEADEFVVVGPDAVGQGGAGVAAASGPGSTYWNPALPGLWEPEPQEGAEREGLSFFSFGNFGFGIGASATFAAEGDILKEADEVNDLVDSTDFSAVQGRLNAGTASTADVQLALRFIDEVQDLNQDEQGIHMAAGASAELRVGWLTFFAHDRLYGGADPFVDFSTGGASALSTGGIDALFSDDGGVIAGPLTSTATAPATQGGLSLRDALVASGFTTNQANAIAIEAEAAIPGSLNDPGLIDAIQAAGSATTAGGSTGLSGNPSGFDIKSLNMREFGVGIAVPVVPRKLSLGVAFKEIIGETSWMTLRAVETEGSDVEEEIREGLDDNQKTTSQPSVDAGIAWQPFPSLRLGIVGKDLMGAEFDLEGRPEDIEIDPQVRAGAYWQPVKLVGFALDADLTENESDVLSGFESQLVGGGVILNIPVLPIILRAGAMKNIASSEAEATYTGGLDLAFLGFKLGVGAAYAPSEVEIESDSNGSKEEIPQRLTLAASIGFSLEW